MLTFGHTHPPSYGDVPYPRVKFALVIREGPKRMEAVMHSVPCSMLRPTTPGAEFVYATTFDELHEYAHRRFGDRGWRPCDACGG